MMHCMENCHWKIGPKNIGPRANFFSKNIGPRANFFSENIGPPDQICLKKVVLAWNFWSPLSYSMNWTSMQQQMLAKHLLIVDMPFDIYSSTG